MKELKYTTDKTMDNVIDYYKGWEAEAISAELDKSRYPLINICMNLTGDFNKASVIRASNAFLAQETWLVGKQRIDRRGTVGTHYLEHIKYSEEFPPLAALLIEQGYTIFPIDNAPVYHPEVIYDTALPVKTAFVYGEEQRGLAEDVVTLCNGPALYIPQYGATRSLNIAQAAAVCMSEYSRRYRSVT